MSKACRPAGEGSTNGERVWAEGHHGATAADLLPRMSDRLVRDGRKRKWSHSEALCKALEMVVTVGSWSHAQYVELLEPFRALVASQDEEDELFLIYDTSTHRVACTQTHLYTDTYNDTKRRRAEETRTFMCMCMYELVELFLCV